MNNNIYTENEVKIETYKDIDIFYNKENGKLHFNFEGKDREVKYLFEAKEIIDEPIWEVCDLHGYFIDGTFNNYIGKAIAKRRDMKTGLPDWLFMGKYDNEYKKQESWKSTKVFPKNEANDKIFNQWEEQRDIVYREEIKLKNILQTLEQI